MECPNGCGDMEQLVSASNELHEGSDNMEIQFSEEVYERCHECGHEEIVELTFSEE